MKNPNIDRWKLKCKEGWGDCWPCKGYGKRMVARTRRREGKRFCYKALRGNNNG